MHFDDQKVKTTLRLNLEDRYTGILSTFFLCLKVKIIKFKRY